MKLGILSGWVVLLAAASVQAADPAYTIKMVNEEAPKDLKDPVRQLLASEAIQVLDPKGELHCQIWLRKTLATKATPEQVKNGLTYRELEESTILGAIRFPQQMTDYRKQRIKPGVYTLRLAFQPADGDHMGTAPFKEFCLVCPADLDAKPDVMEPKAMQELSAKSVVGNNSHPAVFLLFPNEKPAEAPKIKKLEGTHWVVTAKEPVSVGDQKTAIGIGLTVVGASES